MKRISLLVALMAVVAFIAIAEARAPYSSRGAAKIAQSDEFSGETALININNLAMWFRSDGWSARDPLTGNSGVSYPRGTDYAIFADGLIFGGYVRDGVEPALRVGGQTYEIGTRPGRITAKGVADDTGARIYRVRGDFATADLRQDAAEMLNKGLDDVSDDDIAALRAQYQRDWNEWPADWGAPYYDIDGDGSYDPEKDEPSFRNANCDSEPEVCESNADQIAWFVINDLDAGATTSLYGSPPIGLEIQITLWAYARTDALGDVIFKKFRFEYEGTADTPDDSVIEDMYVAQWSDPDLGDYGDDFAGSDVDLSLGYVYNGGDSDSHYSSFGLAPPAAGYDFLQGPIVPALVEVTDDDGNVTVETDESAQAIFAFEKKAGFQNLPMTSYVYFAAGSSIGDPHLGEYDGTLEWYNLLQGYQPQPDVENPVPYTNPITGEDTKFTLDGDPTRATGWNDGVPLPPGDRRIVLNTGPFAMKLGDVQEVVVALIAGLGSDRLRSVSKLKFNDQFVQEAYNNFFEVPKPPSAPKVHKVELDKTIVLNWGVDSTSVSTTENKGSAGFAFEGYNVFQLPSQSATLDQGVKIATFDRKNGVTTILGLTLDEESGVVLDAPLQVGADTGIQRYMVIQKDAIRGRPLVNGQRYYYAVTAYNRNEIEGAATTTLQSAPQVYVCTPQAPRPGIRRQHEEAGESLSVEQVEGIGNATVLSTVIDPQGLQDATYSVTFNDDETWNLLRGDTPLIENEANFSLTDNSQRIVDGLQVKVGGVSFSAPPTYISAEVTTDADKEDGDLVLWGDGTLFGYPNGYASLFWEGGGSSDPTNYVRDLEFRFTGKWNEDKTEVVSGGSIATLGGVSGGSGGRSIDEHPFREGEASESGSFLQRIPFEVWDVENPDSPRQLNVAFFDRGADGSRDEGSVVYHKSYNMPGRDYITVIHSDYDPETIHELTDENTTWVFFFTQGGSSVGSTGDVMKIKIANMIVPGVDKFEFKVVAESFSADSVGVDDIKRINVFPNPYYGLNEMETSRYEHFVTFSHLPAKATIRIFDVAGHMVRKLKKNDPDPFFTWNLDNDNGLPVSSGLYIAHIEMPEVKMEKILKLAIVQEQQFLESY